MEVNEEELEGAFLKYGEELLRTAERKLGDPGLAAELLFKTHIKCKKTLVKHGGRLNIYSSVKAYLAVVLWRTIEDERKKNIKISDKELSKFDKIIAADEAERPDNILLTKESETMEKESRGPVDIALRLFTFKERLVVLARMERIKYREIAKQLGISVKGVEKLKLSAKKKLDNIYPGRSGKELFF